MKTRIILFLIITSVLSCTSMVKYKDDIGFMVSAQADSPEFPVYINGKFCRDVDGIPGLCTKRVKSNESVVIKFDPQQYQYKFHLVCSSSIGVDFNVDVPAGIEYKYEISPSVFSAVKSFTCIGEIFPTDRSNAISSKWEVRIKIYDERYVQREQMHVIFKGEDKYLVLGEYAKYSRVFDGVKWNTYKEKTMIKIADSSKFAAMSESYSSRWNYFNPEQIRAAE